MTIVACLATYPARLSQSVISIKSLLNQVDLLHVVLNGYTSVPPELEELPGVNYIIPPVDLRDVGKFFPDVGINDYVFLCDDDILYPCDYVERMRGHYSVLRDSINAEPILGLHGVIYSDFYDGTPRSGRSVDVFYRELEKFRLVNQLGTGTVLCKGMQLPSFHFMEGSQRFVDVRFARHALKLGFPMVCVPRESGWLQQIEVDSSIYETFTEKHPENVVCEIQEISGMSKIDWEKQRILQCI